ncbi:hypothetical protein HG531_005370 [Fusarium graminearum]|nr:hypothetical protein HG531_005370 [Fusarium graminearum]
MGLERCNSSARRVARSAANGVVVGSTEARTKTSRGVGRGGAASTEERTTCGGRSAEASLVGSVASKHAASCVAAERRRRSGVVRSVSEASKSCASSSSGICGSGTKEAAACRASGRSKGWLRSETAGSVGCAKTS